MKKPFVINTAISAAAHALIIVFLLICSFHSCRLRKTPREITTFIDFQAAPQPDIVSISRTETAKPKTKTIETSKRIIKRDSFSSPKQALTPEEIRKILEVDNQHKPPDCHRDSFSEYLGYIKGMMHGVWMQPPTLSGTIGLITGARIRVRRDGRVERREIIRSSGNELMDASVMTALETVKQIRPLPAGCGDYEDITIDFELTLP